MTLQVLLAKDWVWSVLTLAAAIYFAVVARNAIRIGEVARLNGNALGQVMMDTAADAMPQFRSRQFISREEDPDRFWRAVRHRCLLSFVAALMAIGFLAASLGS